MIKKFFKKVYNILVLARVSNLPTVWSNVLTSIIILRKRIEIHDIFLFLSFSFYYIAGIILNDICDREIDKFQHPDRPLPKNTISLKEAIIIDTIFFILANIFLFLFSFFTKFTPISIILGFFLTFLIILYDFYHKNLFGVFIISLCRAFIYIIISYLIIFKIASSIILISLIIFLYIVGVSFLAQSEEKNITKINFKSLLSISLIFLPFLIFLIMFLYFRFLSNNKNITNIIIILIIFSFIWMYFNIYILISSIYKNFIGIKNLLVSIILIDFLYVSFFYLNFFIYFIFILFFLICFFSQKKIKGT